MKVAGLELKTTSATTFDELVAKALPLVKLDSTIKTVAQEYSSDSAPPLTFSTSPEADDDPDDKANASKTQWDIYRNSHYKQIFLNHFSVKNLVFRSFHFWFLVFGFWSLLAMKLRKYEKYYVIFVYILQGKMGKTEKTGKKITQLK